VAIETVYIQQNTSIIQDEVLAHRIGLVPIKVDPNMFEDIKEDEDPTDLNTIVFKLDVFIKELPEGDRPTTGRKYTQGAFSGDLEWQPQGDQAEKIPGIATVPYFLIIAYCLLLELLYNRWY
jgi:DNA-directed RNA polymerase I and III subunit RPAC1